jgi:hypothetical protein
LTPFITGQNKIKNNEKGFIMVVEPFVVLFYHSVMITSKSIWEVVAE